MGKMSIVFLEGSRLPDAKLQREASRLGPQPLQNNNIEGIVISSSSIITKFA